MDTTKALSFLRSRKQAYLSVFHDKGVNSENVLIDLAKFCRAHTTTYHADPRVHAVLEGRREVWLRIQNHLNLTSDQLWKLYGEDKK